MTCFVVNRLGSLVRFRVTRSQMVVVMVVVLMMMTVTTMMMAVHS